MAKILIKIVKNLFKKPAIKSIVDSIKPAITALILATGITLFLSVVFNIATIDSEFAFDYWSVVIFVIVLVGSLVYKKFRKIILCKSVN